MTEQVSRPAPPASVMATPQGELAWLSWLRVLAIAAVLAIHVGGQAAVADEAVRTTAQLGRVLDFTARWCVPVFVMLSGALLLDPRKFHGAGHFLRRRALRLVPAVIAWHLVYLVYRLVTTNGDTPLDLIEAVLTGRLWTALYFFWIVVGLAVVTPVLSPWVREASRAQQILAGAVAAALPALSVITVPLRSDLDWSADVSWVETPWTWWIPYLGFYLLGYALRDVVLRAWALAACAGTACALSALLVWQWGRQGGFGGLLERFVPAEAYYSPVTVVLAVAVFLTARGLVRPAGFLAPLARGRLARIGRKLGDATLGVFAVHLLVLEVAERMPFIGGEAGALQPDELLARFGFVLAGAYAFSLTCARLPYLRRLV